MNGVSRRDFIKAGAVGGLSAFVIDPRVALASDPTVTPSSNPSGGQLRIAVVQMETVPGAVDKNRGRALALAAEALKNDPDIILFHEELLIGYVSNLRELAEPVNGTTTQAFQSLLMGSKSLVLWGLTERHGDKVYVAGTLVGASGVQANYRKTHLWWHSEGLRDEASHYEPGNELVTFMVKGHKCGVMICYDGDFPEVARCYANMGCSVLFWLNNRADRGYREVRGLARSNSMIMPTACCCGMDETSHICRGGSNITNFDGGLLSEIWDKEGVIYADVNPEDALKARLDNPMYRGRRPELYARYA
jgi:predicted amidohydrolase